jgi:hypothetical protein
MTRAEFRARRIARRTARRERRWRSRQRDHGFMAFGTMTRLFGSIQTAEGVRHLEVIRFVDHLVDTWNEPAVALVVRPDPFAAYVDRTP